MDKIATGGLASRSEYRYNPTMKRLEPAQTIISRFGGPAAVAKLVSVHRTRVSNWKRPREKGGTGGMIPQQYHRTLLDHAEQNSISLAAEDFLPPREEAPASSEPERAS